jgi:hypothetical protein
MVFDEVIDLSGPVPTALQPQRGNANPRNFRLVAELYHQLKKNYDDRQDCWTAGDFHYGEMEMRRLDSPQRSKLLRWLHSNVGLVAGYKYASEYGESYVRPGLWLSFVLVLFTLLYPATGLRYHAQANMTSEWTPVRGNSQSGHAVDLTYGHPLRGAEDKRELWLARLALVGHSGMTSLYVAAFQKDLTYEPSYPWGRLLALVEVMFVSAFAALFLLALRRRFKR